MRQIRHLTATARAGRPRRAVGGAARRRLDIVATDHVPDRLAVEKRLVGQPFNEISNGGPGIETLLAIVYSEGVQRGRVTVERMVDLLSTTPARLVGLNSKGLDRSRQGR